MSAAVTSASGELTLASAPAFTVAPGAAVTVSVDYAPADVGDDAGTLDLTTSDPAQPSVAIPLAGSGALPPPVVVDLDIAQLRVTNRVSLGRVRPVAITLVVKNEGVVEGEALATIVGMQGGTEVYRVTQTVTDPLGNGRTTYTFSYTPTATGEILWTATLADGDPDDDVATATTNVVP